MNKETMDFDSDNESNLSYLKLPITAGVVSTLLFSLRKGNPFKLSSSISKTAVTLSGYTGMSSASIHIKDDEKKKSSSWSLANYRQLDPVSKSKEQGFSDSKPTAPDKKCKIVQDCIHGAVELKPLICKIIDTRYFQRQRNLFQLGLTCFVFPTASHTRFEHAIGTYHLASKFLARLLQEQEELLRKELKVTDLDIQCVEIAALCHDIGHGPFSHFWDLKFIPRQSAEKGFDKVKHEEWSARILDLVFEEIKNSKEYKESKLDERYIKFIKCLILGSDSIDKYLSEEDVKVIFPDGVEKKKFLFEIVSNSETKVDVDKWDYLSRDSMYLGCGNIFPGFIIQRYMLMYRVKQCGKEYKLALRNSETFSIMAMFQMRHHLHRIAYQHKVKEPIEEMLYDALASADKVYKFSDITKKPMGDEEIPKENVEKYLALSDYLFWAIINSQDENLSYAKHLFERILRRDLYKVIHVFHVPKEQIKDGIVKQCEEAIDREMFGISLAQFDFGKGNENPLKHIYFFDEQKKKVMQGEWRISDMLIPKIFEESELRLIDKRPKEERMNNPEEALNAKKVIAAIVHEFSPSA